MEAPPGGKQCTHILDPFGRHAACCTKGLHTRRHDRIRDLITKLARQTGLTTTIEQAMLIPDQILPDGQPAPAASARSTEQTSIVWGPRGRNYGSMSRSTVAPELSVAKEFLREEQNKCREYGQRDGYNLQALEKGMTPIVLEQYGCAAPRAQAIFNRIIDHRLQIFVRHGMPFFYSFMQRGSPAPSSGALFQARCLEQPGRPKNRLGRFSRHTPKPAELPRGVTAGRPS